ncbi:hypothetical protein IU501_01080 [Nocardia otitidiscaviarum]|uniref:hypothetical protein n=1 Tax=Nocardia otitidiscaviarum TaxID=1823 RepID=UPI00189375CA|nr:hypothetical protein [Nocardia otitidiscaviarum]MBF6131598.1 hypothetical protein [Nocardia otitidiscaviarum]
MWTTIGFIVAVGLPLVVLVLAILWPERIPKERTVHAIQQRIADEDGPYQP